MERPRSYKQCTVQGGRSSDKENIITGLAKIPGFGAYAATGNAVVKSGTFYVTLRYGKATTKRESS